MFTNKSAMFLVFIILMSLVAENESYIGVVDSDTYRTVTNFANECVKWRDLQVPKKIRKKLRRIKKVKL